MNVGEFLLIAGCSIIIAAGITAWRFRPKPRVGLQRRGRRAADHAGA